MFKLTNNVWYNCKHREPLPVKQKLVEYLKTQGIIIAAKTNLYTFEAWNITDVQARTWSANYDSQEHEVIEILGFGEDFSEGGVWIDGTLAAIVKQNEIEVLEAFKDSFEKHLPAFVNAQYVRTSTQ